MNHETRATVAVIFVGRGSTVFLEQRIGRLRWSGPWVERAIGDGRHSQCLTGKRVSGLQLRECRFGSVPVPRNAIGAQSR